MTLQIRRWVLDVYAESGLRLASGLLTGTMTRRQASARILQQLAGKGVTGFRDRAGRSWEMGAYAEMVGRTTAAQASVQGHADRLTALGVDTVLVSNAPEECKQCRKWEGRVLSLTGKTTGRLSDGVTVAGTLTEAKADGLYHPNAILGDHSFRAVGQVENAVRSWYEGPSVQLTTAGGVRLTVSPNHPVLTSRGWVRAEGLHEGDKLFRPREIRRGLDAAEVGDQVHDVPPGVAEVFDSLASVCPNMSVPAAGDDLHGDGKFCQGEIDVVVADGGLLPVANTEGVQECSHGRLSGSGVEGLLLPGPGALDLGLQRVGTSVAGALSNVHASGLEPTAQGRVADSEDVSEVLAGLPGEVEVDELVDINREWFRGHAYDFQTSFGAYLVNSILVHNCRHSHSIYLPGVTRPLRDTADPEGDKLRQQQRARERRIRDLKRREILTEHTDPAAHAAAKAARRKAEDDFSAWREEHDRKNLSYRTNLKTR